MVIATMIAGRIHVVVLTHNPTWSVIFVMEREDGMSVLVAFRVHGQKTRKKENDCLL